MAVVSKKHKPWPAYRKVVLIAIMERALLPVNQRISMFKDVMRPKLRINGRRIPEYLIVRARDWLVEYDYIEYVPCRLGGYGGVYMPTPLADQAVDQGLLD